MDLHRIINFCAAGLLVLDIIWFLIRLKKNAQNRKNLEKGELVRTVCIYVSSICIIIFCFFIDFGLMGNIALNGCSVLGVETANRQFFVDFK